MLPNVGRPKPRKNYGCIAAGVLALYTAGAGASGVKGVEGVLAEVALTTGGTKWAPVRVNLNGAHFCHLPSARAIRRVLEQTCDSKFIGTDRLGVT